MERGRYQWPAVCCVLGQMSLNLRDVINSDRALGHQIARLLTGDGTTLITI